MAFLGGTKHREEIWKIEARSALERAHGEHGAAHTGPHHPVRYHQGRSAEIEGRESRFLVAQSKLCQQGVMHTQQKHDDMP